MNPIATLSWQTDEVKAKAWSVDEAVRVAESVDRECQDHSAVAVHVERPDGEALLIVVGAERSCLEWFPTGYDGAGSYHSMAEALASDEGKDSESGGILAYYVYGHYTEAPVEYAVPKELAFQALHEFLSCSGRPRSVRWVME